MSFHELISLCSIWIIFLPLLIGLIFYWRLNQLSKTMLLLVFIGAITQLIIALNKTHKFDWINLCYNAYTPLEFFIIMFFLFQIFKRDINEQQLLIKIQRVILLCVISYISLTCLIFTFENPYTDFRKKVVFINNFFFTGWILYYLYQMLLSENVEFGFRQSSLWYLIAYLLYVTMSALYFIIIPDKDKSSGIVEAVDTIQNVANIILYIFISIGFIMDYKKLKNAQ